MSDDALAALRETILALVADYAEAKTRPGAFRPGVTPVNYAGRVYDAHEMTNLVASALDFWLTAGACALELETKLRDLFGAREFLLVNSGSSANLLMIATLCADELRRRLRDDAKRPLQAGDEVITPAVTFPTTLAPIVQHGLVPVFVDCEVGTYNVDPGLVAAAVGPRTRAVFVPHTLGIPCDMDAIGRVARDNDLWLLEDGCDALGATFDDRLVGTFGAMSSVSFYPAHHMTTGEGGGVAVNDPRLARTATSIRDWGRDCWCAPGASGTCGRRFGQQHGALPAGYDHKYVYSNLGYNLKVTDMQAAIGLAQFEKVPGFVAARRRNFWRLHEGLRPLQDRLVLPVVDPRANPSPFGFAVTVRPGVERADLVRWLEDSKIETRSLFGGNILRQPGFANIAHRVAGTLERSDRIMTDTFFVGVYPGLTDEMVDFVTERFHDYFARQGRKPPAPAARGALRC